MQQRAKLIIACGCVAVAAAVVVAAHHGSSSAPPPPFASIAGTGGSTRFVSPEGSDGWTGSLQHPWRSLRTALKRARPGETIVLLPGTYGARGTRLTWSLSGRPRAPITIRGVSPRQRPVILGYNKITGSHLRLFDLSFIGPTGAVDERSDSNPGGEEVMIWVTGSDVVIGSSEIAHSLWHAGIYVTGSGVRLIGNYIHDNGNFSDPAQANLDHGIYWGAGDGGLVADNLIFHNLANGVQLYPDSRHVTVEMNTIVANGKAGIILGADASDNTIANNIVALNADNSIRSSGLSGGGNVVENNLVWRNGSGNIGTDAEGLTLIHTIQRDPRFVGRWDFALRQGSPAIGSAWRLTPAVSYDIQGLPRGGRPDLGAYQSG